MKAEGRILVGPLGKQKDSWHKPKVWEETHPMGRTEGVKIE